MSKIRFGVQIHPQHVAWKDYLAAAQRYDEMGVDTIFNWDHFFPLYGPEDAPMNEMMGDFKMPAGREAWHFEAWTSLTALAMGTKHAEVGCLVTCNSYRNPQLLADMARTVDHISGGRLILGIGSGWYEKDYVEYGYEFGTAPSWLQDLKRDLPILRDRWSKLTPPPTRPIPILVGGGGEKVTLRIVAEHAQIWNGFGPPDQFKRKNGILDGHCQEIGRNPKEIERSVGISVKEIDNLPAYVEAGAEHIIVMLGTPFDAQPVEKLLAWRDRL